MHITIVDLQTGIEYWLARDGARELIKAIQRSELAQCRVGMLDLLGVTGQKFKYFSLEYN